MKRFLPILIVIIVIAVGAGIYAATKNNSNSNSNSSNGTSNMSGMDHTNQPASNSSSNAQATSSVTIKDFAFSPAAITVKKGTTVTWTNQDSTAHTVTETDGKTGPNSQNLDNGKSYSFTYDTVGTFQYICSIHPYMKGTVTVTE